MHLSGIGHDEMKKILATFLSGENKSFASRSMIAENKQGDILPPPGYVDQNDFISNENREFRNQMAYLYLKTFYGKKPEDFKTKDYKNECLVFNDKLKNVSSDVVDKIQECLGKGSVDFDNGELPSNIFYDISLYADLASDAIFDRHPIFVKSTGFEQARIYVNPSLKDYRHLLNYIISKCAESEIPLGVKPRILHLGEGQVDNLILYLDGNTFIDVVEILEQYGNEFPEKTKDFGPTSLMWATGAQKWFGVGHCCQCFVKFKDDPTKFGQFGDSLISDSGRHSLYSYNFTTYNNYTDDIFNNYILPNLIFQDFKDIFRGADVAEVLDVLTSVVKNEDSAKNLFATISDAGKFSSFLNSLKDLSKLTAKLNEYIERNRGLAIEHEFGIAPTDYLLKTYNSEEGGQKPSEQLLEKEDIQIPKRFGAGAESVKRSDMVGLYKNSQLRNRMREYYLDSEHPERLEDAADKLVALSKNVCRAIPFLDNDNICFSQTMSNEISKRKLKESKVIVSDLMSPMLSVKLMGMMGASDVQAQVPNLHGCSREKLEEMYIGLVGLDKVLDALSVIMKLEPGTININTLPFGNTLIKMRMDRGRALAEQAMNMTEEEMNKFVRSCSEYAKKDIGSYADRVNVLDNLNESVIDGALMP